MVGHVECLSEDLLTKTILVSEVEGGRERSRPSTRLLNEVKNGALQGH